MNEVLPQVIAVLSHVILLLSVILTSILSLWIQRRVKLAAVKLPFDYTSSYFAISEGPKAFRRHSEAPVTKRKLPVVKRSLSLSSGIKQCVETSSNASSSLSAKSRQNSTRMLRSYSSSPSYDSSAEIDPFFSSPEVSPPQPDSKLDYWISDGQTPNSPTGSLLDDYDKGVWLPAASEILTGRAVSGRRSLCFLLFLRAAIGLPALLQSWKPNTTSFSHAFLLNFDLLIADAVVASLLAVAPLLIFVVNLSLRLPEAWEHHIYHTNMLLAITPLLATLQLPPSDSMAIYRLAGPVLSAVIFLIAREQALATYWAPLTARESEFRGL